MRKWQCHKIVEAETITGNTPSGGYVSTESGDIFVPRDFFARGTPDRGDYIVRYEDGYLSWSPKKVFEDGYTEIQEGVA